MLSACNIIIVRHIGLYESNMNNATRRLLSGRAPELHSVWYHKILLHYKLGCKQIINMSTNTAIYNRMVTPLMRHQVHFICKVRLYLLIDMFTIGSLPGRSASAFGSIRLSVCLSVRARN